MKVWLSSTNSEIADNLSFSTSICTASAALNMSFLIFIFQPLFIIFLYTFYVRHPSMNTTTAVSILCFLHNDRDGLPPRPRWCSLMIGRPAVTVSPLRLTVVRIVSLNPALRLADLPCATYGLLDSRDCFGLFHKRPDGVAFASVRQFAVRSGAFQIVAGFEGFGFFDQCSER